MGQIKNIKLHIVTDIKTSLHQPKMEPFNLCTSTTTTRGRLDDVITYFTLQARHHLQQYKMYQYYAKYYTKYRTQLSKSKDKAGGASPACTASRKTGHTTDSSCGYYFKSSTTHPLKTKKRSRRNRKRRQRLSSFNVSTEVAGCSKGRVEVAEAIESSDESDEEIDIGYQEFMRQSEQFRKERDATRVMRNTRGRGRDAMEDESEDVPLECVEYVDVLRKGPDGTILPPTASNRKQMYEEKYGHCGTKILSLETALQWKFNSVIDSTSPKPWPALPIRFLNQN